MKGNLLLIDDEEMILESSKDLLEDIADKIFTANRGAKGIEVFKSETIHCILCDINMPEMNGIEVIKQIRELNANVPFIFYTAHGSDELMREAVKFGAFDFLDKPALEGLEEIVERGLKAGVGSKEEAPANFISEFQKLSN
ncbi:MAG: transcriptional regulator [Halobacteriovorax sp.]|nr:transcriptional regulator [Halobacteriovorax sp.]